MQDVASASTGANNNRQYSALKRSHRRRVDQQDDNDEYASSSRRCYSGSSSKTNKQHHHAGLPDMNTMYMEMEGLSSSVERRALHDPLTGDTTVASPLAHPPPSSSSSFSSRRQEQQRSWKAHSAKSQAWRAPSSSSKQNKPENKRDVAPIFFSDPCSDASVMTGMSQQELIRKKVRDKKSRKNYSKRKKTIVQILPGMLLAKESPRRNHKSTNESPGRGWNLMRTFQQSSSSSSKVVTDDLSTVETSHSPEQQHIQQQQQQQQKHLQQHARRAAPHKHADDNRSISEYSFPLLSRDATSGNIMLHDEEPTQEEGMGSFLLETPEEEPVMMTMMMMREPVASVVVDKPYHRRVHAVEQQPPEEPENHRPRAVRFAKGVGQDDNDQPWDESEESPTSVMVPDSNWTPPQESALEETAPPKSILRTSKFVPQPRSSWQSPPRTSFLDREGMEVSPIRPVRAFGHPAEKHAASLYREDAPVMVSISRASLFFPCFSVPVLLYSNSVDFSLYTDDGAVIRLDGVSRNGGSHCHSNGVSPSHGRQTCRHAQGADARHLSSFAGATTRTAAVPSVRRPVKRRA